jgi:hypothetical protein
MRRLPGEATQEIMQVDHPPPDAMRRRSIN